MQKYHYTGINQQEERVKGHLIAANLPDAERQVAQMGIELLSLREQKDTFAFMQKKRVSNKDIITMTFQIEQLLRSGVPLLDILDDMQASFPAGYFRDLLAGLYDAMLNGATFAEALSRYPDDFDEVYVSLVAIGEKTGQLEMILHDLGMNMRWQDELESKAKKIMIYPAIVFSVVIMVITFLMLFLVPELVKFIQGMGQELGMLTLSLISVSNYFVDYWHLTALAIIAAFVWFKMMMYYSPTFRKRIHKWVLGVPLIGSILFKLKIARMTSTMAIMYAAGVSLQQIIHMAGKVVGNDYLYERLSEVESHIMDGHTIVNSFDSVKIFPPLILKLIKVGETTGRMDESLRNISYFYDREAKELIDKVEPAIEPIITLILAVLVGWVMMATLGPVYDIIGNIR
ncbi:MAG: type II secretion system F family protein [Gammaproteobacteria bacterium]|nr:type II secretion system F family protein [Gammaproteobacteria bacterium]